VEEGDVGEEAEVAKAHIGDAVRVLARVSDAGELGLCEVVLPLAALLGGADGAAAPSMQGGAQAALALTTLQSAAQVAGASVAGVILVGFGFVIALAIWRSPTLQFVGVLERLVPFELGKRLHLQDAARYFAEGTDSLREPRLWLVLLGWTALTWVCSVGSSLFGVVALGVQPLPEAVLLVVILTSTGQAVPSSPGYVGVYHAASTLALTAFGVDTATAFGIALITHAFSYGSLVVAGLIALWTGGYTFGDVLNGIRSRPAVSPARASAEL